MTEVSAPPRHAATIVVVRPRTGTVKPEVFMVKRHRNSGFMASAYVYPGGKLDTEDTASELLARTKGMTPGQALHRFAVEGAVDGDALLTPDEALGIHVAGVRELFEEAGILLAQDLEVHSDTLDQWRAELEAGLAFGALVQREKLVLRPDRLHYFAHWITPDIEPRRYNTRFFLAVAPTGQEGYHDDRETVDSAWVTPREAIDRYAGSEIQLAPPTLRTLEDMVDYDTVDALLEGMVPSSIPTILPRFETVDDVFTLLMPGDPLYPSCAPVQGPTRVTLRDGRWWSENSR